MSTELETPAHYKGTAIIDFCEKHYLGFSFGNVVKYLLRHPQKGGVEDLKKALVYLDKAQLEEASDDEECQKDFLQLIKEYETTPLINAAMKILSLRDMFFKETIKTIIEAEIARLECQS